MSEQLIQNNCNTANISREFTSFLNINASAYFQSTDFITVALCLLPNFILRWLYYLFFSKIYTVSYIVF